MNTLVCLFAVLTVAVLVDSMPTKYVFEEVPVVLLRAKRAPGHTMMLRGYYGRPVNRRQGYEGAISTATAGAEPPQSDCKSCANEQEEVDINEGIYEEERDEILPERTPEVAPPAVHSEGQLVEDSPKPLKPKAPKQSKPEEDEDEDTFAFVQPGRKTDRVNYNTFFPMNFGLGGGARNGAEGFYPGATAIANSFSTGSRGAATSHATAYGPRYMGRS